MAEPFYDLQKKEATPAFRNYQLEKEMRKGYWLLAVMLVFLLSIPFCAAVFGL